MRTAGYVLFIGFVVCLLSVGYYVNNYYYQSISGALVTNIKFNGGKDTKEIIIYTDKGRFVIPANIQDMAYYKYDNKRTIKIFNAVDDDEHFNELSNKIQSFLSTEVILDQTMLDIEYIIKDETRVVRNLYYQINH